MMEYQNPNDNWRHRYPLPDNDRRHIIMIYGLCTIAVVGVFLFIAGFILLILSI